MSMIASQSRDRYSQQEVMDQTLQTMLSIQRNRHNDHHQYFMQHQFSVKDAEIEKIHHHGDTCFQLKNC